MSESETTPERRAQDIVEDVLRRRRKGERVPSDRVLQYYPDLRDCLEPLLRKADILSAAWNGAPSDPPAPRSPTGLEQLLERMGEDPDLPPLSGASPPPAEPAEKAPPPAIDPKATVREEDVPPQGEVHLEVNRTPSVRPPVKVAQRAIDAPRSASTHDLEPPAEASPPVPYRPTMRPPIGLLRVLDDDQQRGEIVRIRKSEFVIGREQGDLVIPHDMQISARHAAILRIDDKQGSTFTLRDLRAANGVFVRVRRIDLRGGDRFLLANALVRFVPATGGNPNRLEELTPQGIGDTLPLVRREHWIGRDPRHCERFLQRNPMIDARMACITCDDEGRWTIRCSDSLNGMWERVLKADLKSGSMFQLGEQRFVFEVG